MTAQEAEIYPWTESNPAARLSEEGGSTGLVARMPGLLGFSLGMGWRTSPMASALHLVSSQIESYFRRMVIYEHQERKWMF